MSLTTKVAAWHQRTRARTYLFMYFGLVFGFAGVYTLMPDSFYHSTIRSQPAFKAEGRTLRLALSDVLTDTSRTIELDIPQGHVLLEGRMFFDNLRVEEDEAIAFDVTMLLHFTRPVRRAEVATFQVRTRADDDYWLIPKSLGIFNVILAVDIRQVAGPQVPSAVMAGLWNCPGYRIEGDGERMCLPDSLRLALAAYRRAWGGTPSGSSQG